jgi:diaminopimelate epimerase
MRLKFSKMHGLGNDFMVIDAITQNCNLSSEQIRALADRHLGIGFDQLLLVETPRDPDVDFHYRIFNADGYEVEHCGNGIRCLGRFVHLQHLTGKHLIIVSTNTGRAEVQLLNDQLVKVDMGRPILVPANIPLLAAQQQITYTLPVDDQLHELAVVSMGNPHGILLVEQIDSAPVSTLGAKLESHPYFPQRANIGFMQIIDRHNIHLRVFERAVGETRSCGTGACAAVVAGKLNGLLESSVNVGLPGGNLQIQWSGGGASLTMTGPATHVFDGQVRL